MFAKGKVARIILTLWLILSWSTLCIAQAAPAGSITPAEIAHAVSVMAETWSVQTFQGLLAGKVAIPDRAINECLLSSSEQTTGNERVTIESLDNGKIKINAETEKWGKTQATATIDAFIHDSQQSVLKMKVEKKEILGEGIKPWIFRTLGSGVFSVIYGPLDLGEGYASEVNGDVVTVDMHKQLYASKAGQVELFGIKLLDMIAVDGITTHNGYMEVQTRLLVSDSLRKVLERLNSARQ